jgi:hypothetical protein
VIVNSGLSVLPIDPFVIAQAAEIEVREKVSDEPGVAGFLMRRGNSFGIMYATHIKSEGFIRFTVAHELGHYHLPGHPEALFPNGEGEHRSRSGFISADQYERQADYFASALLMPERLFVAAMPAAGAGFRAIQQLSVRCKTSLPATAIRFAHFTDDPVAVIVSSRDKIDYCFASPALKNVQGVGFIKGELVPPRSETGKFNKDPKNVALGLERAGYTSLDDWFDGAPQIEMKEDVVGLGTYGKTLTVLFREDPIEDPDEDSDDDYE